MVIVLLKGICVCLKYVQVIFQIFYSFLYKEFGKNLWIWNVDNIMLNAYKKSQDLLTTVDKDFTFYKISTAQIINRILDTIQFNQCWSRNVIKYIHMIKYKS